MNAVEIAAITGPFTTLAAGLGAVWLQGRGEPARELRGQRRRRCKRSSTSSDLRGLPMR